MAGMPRKPAQPQKPPQSADTPSGGTILAERLCALSGLTDRRHRQLASQGFFPPPIRGEYQAGATIQGLLRYYREQSSRTRNQRDQIDGEKLRKLKLANDWEAGKLVETARLMTLVAAALQSLRDLTYAKLEQEAPMAMATLDVPSARIVGRRMASELLLRWQEIFAAWKV